MPEVLWTVVRVHEWAWQGHLLLAVWFVAGLGRGFLRAGLRPASEGDSGCKMVAGWLARKPEGYYRGMLGWLLGRVAAWYGDRPFGWWALEHCLLVALVYPVVVLMLGWVLGGPGEMAGEAVLPEVAFGWRVVVILGMVLGIVLLVLGMNNEARGRVFARIGLAGVDVWFRRRRWWVGLCLQMGFLIAGMSLIFATAGIGAVAGAVASAVVFAAAITVAVAVSVVFVFTVGGVFAGEAGVAASPILWSYAALLIVLPVLNGLFDWLSWGVSRKLLGLIVRPGAGRWVGLRDAVLDLLAALGLLLGLAVALPAAVELLNALLGAAESSTDVRLYLDAAREAPLGAGLAVTAMLVTTLLPTAGHFVLAIGAFVLQPLPGRGWARRTLLSPDHNRIQRSFCAAWVVARFFAFPATLLVLVVWGLTALLHLPVGESLCDVAEWSAAVVRGWTGRS